MLNITTDRMEKFGLKKKLKIVERAFNMYLNGDSYFICACIHNALFEYNPNKYGQLGKNSEDTKVIAKHFMPLFAHHKPDNVGIDDAWWKYTNRSIRIKIFKEMIKNLKNHIELKASK
jgi:YHS domain-containing protein